jgi:tetratricopeptide (TPR) repeat protein
MPRDAEFDIAERHHEDDAWFAEGNARAARDRKARLILGVAMAVLLLVGIAAGAFSSGEPPAGPDLGLLRARAAASPSALEAKREVLIAGLDRLIATLPKNAPDVVSAPEVVAADAGGAVAVAEADAGPAVRVEPKPEARPKPVEITEPKVAEPKVTEPKVMEPKVMEPKVTEPKVMEPKVTEPKVTEPKVTEPKVTEPKVTELVIPEPKPKDPEAVAPRPTEPKPAEPKPADAKVEDPKGTDAKSQAPLDEALAAAKAHLDGGRWAEARTAYEKALALAPGHPRALLGRGRASLELRQVQAALKDIQAVLEVEPKNPTALLLAGSISQEQGQRDLARGYYQRYLDAWPGGRKANEVKSLLERL